MRWRTGLTLAVPMALLAMVGSTMPSATRAADAEAALPTFADVQPTLERYCYPCHGANGQAAGLTLHTFGDEASVRAERGVWTSVLGRVGNQSMPPAGMPQPSDAERAELVAWIDATLHAVDCDGPREPGRVTVRRLNRAEYANTIRDLFGLDLKLTADFPSDDVGYGFDNIGDVLSLPPLLMERYLDAAEHIAEAAILADGPQGPRVRFEAEQVAGESGSAEGGLLRWNSYGEAAVAVTAPSAGAYVVRARAFGQQAGPDPCRLAVRLNGQDVAVIDVPATRPTVYETALTLPAGEHRLSVAFINDYYAPDDPDPSQRDRNFAIDWFELQGPARPADAPLPDSHTRIFVATPADGSEAAWLDAAHAVLAPLGRRVWRRPLTADELARLTTWVLRARQDEDTFERGIQTALKVMLVSPRFLFRLEGDPAEAVGVYALNDHAVATRLSYFLWSSTPDDELLMLAGAGALHDPEVLTAQVQRMLADPKAEALTHNFAGQWLQLRNLDTVHPSPTAFPGFEASLKRDMRTETELFFSGIVRDDRSVLELLDADYTYLNERLAKHYGIDGVSGAGFRRVKLSGEQAQQRGGVLTQASVLTVTSNPTRTSPVKRGKFVLDNILGTPPPSQPANVPPLPDDLAAVTAASLRERMEQHREDPNCAVCHIEMDAIGFGFENYDAIGRWRTKDGRFDVDSAGELPGGRRFASPAELRSLLAMQRELFVRCLAEKLLTYALGRGLEPADACTVRDIVAAAEADDYRFSALVNEIVVSAPFLMRRSADTH